MESRLGGDATGILFCGKRLYSVVGEPAFIQFDEKSREITLSTSDEIHIGQH